MNPTPPNICFVLYPVVAVLMVTACGAEPDDKPSDTGAPELVACAESPCVAEVANAAWNSGAPGLEGGQALAASGDIVLVSEPCSLGKCGYAGVTMLALDGLTETRSWSGTDLYGLPGTALAIADLGDGAPMLAASQIAGGSSGYSYAFVFAPTAEGDLEEAASLTFVGGGLEKIGTDLGFAAVGGGPEEWLVVGAVGGTGLADGAIYAIDPLATGELTTSDADMSLTGAPGLGGQFATLDLDGDGQVDLAPTGAGSLAVAFFPGPWTGSGTEADALGEWTDDRPEFQLGDRVNPVGDVTGDGIDDLAFCACTWGDDPYRVGRAYVVAGSSADLAFGPADELPIQIQGGFVGEGVGYGLAGADITGDGVQDLIVGASGVPPGNVPGAILVFPGPVSGVQSTSDAPIRLYGEYPGDLFGRAMAIVDADADAQADLVVGAHWWPSGASEGAAYLILGADLAP